MDLSIQKKRKEEAEVRRNKKEEEEEEALCLEEEETRKRDEVRLLLLGAIAPCLFVFVTTVNLQQSFPQYDVAKLWISPYIRHAKRNPKSGIRKRYRKKRWAFHSIISFLTKSAWMLILVCAKRNKMNWLHVLSASYHDHVRPHDDADDSDAHHASAGFPARYCHDHDGSDHHQRHDG